MRLWSLHPKHLDSKGLVALWREGLLARKVLKGKTKGYRNHPQLERFRDTRSSNLSIDAYLHHVADEADRRSYQFDRSKLGAVRAADTLLVSQGQLAFEWNHLRGKLEERDTGRAEQLADFNLLEAHPLFEIVEGSVAAWERP